MKNKNQLGVSRTQKGGNNGFPIYLKPKELRPKPLRKKRIVELKEAREMAATRRLWQGTVFEETKAIIILDNRITELEAERDKLLDVCRGILNGLENVQIDILQAEIAKYNKDLPKFKDIIGLYAENKPSLTE